jgi:hypothetical protein
MDAEPLVRASFCQEWLTFMETQEDPWRSRFLAAIDPELRETIESSSRVAWLPLAIHVKLADILQESFGAARAHTYYRRAFASSLTGPILGSLVRTGAAILGVSVPTFVRWAPRGWGAAFRNAGGLEGEVLGPNRATVTYVGLPKICTASDGWMLSAQGSVYGVYDILGIDGVVRIDLSKRSEGRMVLGLEWSTRGQGTLPPSTTSSFPRKNTE